MADNLPLPLHIADLPVGATFTHKGVEYRKVRYNGGAPAAEIMAARNPEHPNVRRIGGSLQQSKTLSVCAECPASVYNVPAPYRGCTFAYPLTPCSLGRANSGTLILTIDTAYELAVAGVASW